MIADALATRVFIGRACTVRRACGRVPGGLQGGGGGGGGGG